MREKFACRNWRQKGYQILCLSCIIQTKISWVFILCQSHSYWWSVPWHITGISHAVLEEDHPNDMLFQQYKVPVHFCYAIHEEMLVLSFHIRKLAGVGPQLGRHLFPLMTPFAMEQNWHRWPYHLPTAVFLTLYHLIYLLGIHGG